MNILRIGFIVFLFVLMTHNVMAHGGGLDNQGGHNCSDKSKRKGLCSGYHTHG